MDLRQDGTTTARAAAQRLGISRQAVMELLRRGRLDGTMREGRWVVPVREVERWEQKRAAERNRKGEPRSVKRHAKEPATTPTDSD